MLHRNKTHTSDEDEYQLKVDEQSDHFLSLLHNLSYFLISAAIIPLGVTLKFAFDAKTNIDGLGILFLVSGALCSIASVASIIWSLQNNLGSHALHIRARYDHKSYDDVAAEEQGKWGQYNKNARYWRRVGLFLQIPSLVFLAVFSIYTISLRNNAVSDHVNPPFITQDDGNYRIRFTNRYTDREVVVNVPKQGVTGHDDSSETSKEHIDKIAEGIHKILLKELEN